MPKKISFSADMKLNVDVDRLRNHETLCIKIAQIMTVWAQVEMHMATAFAYLLGKEDERALMIYNEFIDSKLKHAAFIAVARNVLNPEMVDAANKIFTKVREKAKQRNAVAHAHWATSEKYPTSLFAISSKHLLVEVHKSSIARREKDQARKISDDLEIFEWKEADFTRNLQNINMLRAEVRDFAHRVQTHVAAARTGLV